MITFTEVILLLLQVSACAGASPVGLGEPKGSYVEFDFSTLPYGGDGKYSFTITIKTMDKDISWSEPQGGDRSLKPEEICDMYAVFMEFNRWRAKVVDKTKLRVYGRNFNDKLIPAIEGKVTSPDLKKEELPKVKNPPKA
jgi:hypothetical protein